MDATSKEISRKTTAKRRFSFKRLCVILLVMAAAGLIISEATGNTQALADFLNPPMHFVEAAYITHEAGAGAQIFATDGGFFLATRDAMRFHNADGAEVFRHSHAMANPVLFGRGSYAAILEQGGRLFHVYNAQGLLYSIPTDAPIVRFALGMQGFAAIMTDGGRGILDIAVYNNFGTMFYYGGHADENIVPLLMDISHDGRVMAISYLDINDAQMNSFISLVSIYGNHAGADGIFAENRHNPGQIIGSMRFLANGSLVALSDTRIFVLNSVAETIWETPLGNRVTHVEFADNWFAVAYGDAMLNRPGHPSGTVIARNSFGIELFAHTTAGGAVRNLQAQGGNLVVGCNQGHLTALSNNGQVLWEKRLAGNVRDVGMLGDSNSLAALSPGQTSVLRRVRNN
ncbi:MAG: DUF5711 family protein [Clostridiales bacterium]|jgi:hypothetical protein|nr:DUF5711 family protein [Clostridiales bacterium]